MKMSSSVSFHLARTALALALGGVLLVPGSRAFQFNDGDLSGSLDSTFSFGGLARVGKPSAMLYGTTNSFQGVPGQQNSVNADDGNLN